MYQLVNIVLVLRVFALLVAGIQQYPQLPQILMNGGTQSQSTSTTVYLPGIHGSPRHGVIARYGYMHCTCTLPCLSPALWPPFRRWQDRTRGCCRYLAKVQWLHLYSSQPASQSVLIIILSLHVISISMLYEYVRALAWRTFTHFTVHQRTVQHKYKHHGLGCCSRPGYHRRRKASSHTRH